MGNKKRKLGGDEKIPKISYGLSRSVIEQQRGLHASAPNLIPKIKTDESEVLTKSKQKTSKRQSNKMASPALPSSSQSDLLSDPLSSPPITELNSPTEPSPSLSTSPQDHPTDSIQFTYGTNQVGALLHTPHSKLLHISGMCTLKLIAGKGNINGYRLRIDEEITIHSPPWMPAVRLFFENVTNSSHESESSNKKILTHLLASREYLRPYKRTLQQQFLPSSSSSSLAIIEIRSIEMSQQNWMIRCEDYSKYQQPSQLSPSLPCPPPVNYLSSAIVGSSNDLIHLGFECQTLPTDWVAAGDLFCKSIKTSPRAMLFGAKGAGK
jgi:hypothetical protein